MKVFEKEIADYIKTLKLFLAAFFVVALLQLALLLFDIFPHSLEIAITGLKGAIVFAAGFLAVKKYGFNLKQAAFCGFLHYMVIIWLQPLVSIIFSQSQSFVFLAQWTGEVIVAGLFTFSVIALVGAWIAQTTKQHS